MARLYSARFVSENGDGTTHGFTVPDEVIWVIRDVDVYSDVPIGLDSGQCIVGIETVPFFWTTTGPDTTTHDQWQGRQVLNAGESLEVYADANVAVTISGYVLSAP